jgi:hypothetical protein
VALTKVEQTTLYAIAETAANEVSIGSEVDVSTYYAAHIRVRMGRASASAFTAVNGAGPRFRTEAAGQTVVSLAAGTNFAAGDYVFFHNTTIGNSEWSRVKSVSGADLTLEEGIVNAQTGATCRDQAEQFDALIDLTAIQRIRCVADAAGNGQAVIWQAEAGFVAGI